jgi:hypothetical protein
MSIIIGGNTLDANDLNPSGNTVNVPNVVTRDLILWLDAGNNSSYINSSNYYDCGYGCMYYSSNPGCTNCNTQIKDMSGFGHDGTFNGGMGISQTAGGGGSMLFDGINDYVNITSTALLNPNSGVISVGAWFYSTETGSENDRIIFNKENEYELSAGGGFVSYAFRPNWAWVGRTAFNLNQWYYTMVTYDQSFQRLYLNGVEVYSAALSGAIGDSYTNDLRIGARGAPGASSSHFKGYIAAVHVYNRSLSSAEVLQNYNNGRIRFGV